MKKIKITTPENIEVEYTLADVASRTAATAIDTLIQGVIFILLVLADFLIARFSKSFWEIYYGWIIGITLLVYFLISFGFYIIMELNMNGSTPGKKLLKLRVIRTNGQPMALKHSAIRNLFKILIDSFGIGIAFIFFSKEHRRPGDYAASTIVVMDEEYIKPVSLESLQKYNEHFSYYFSEEELKLLREYQERKNGLDDSTRIRTEMVAYFTEKFEALGILNEWEGFIREL